MSSLIRKAYCAHELTGYEFKVKLEALGEPLSHEHLPLLRMRRLPGYCRHGTFLRGSEGLSSIAS
jgi:hypothetical protein